MEDQKLMDFQGDYDFYLEQNEDEAAKMEVKETAKREIEKDNIKATSKLTKAEREKNKKDKAKAFAQAQEAKKKK